MGCVEGEALEPGPSPFCSLSSGVGLSSSCRMCLKRVCRERRPDSSPWAIQSTGIPFPALCPAPDPAKALQLRPRKPRGGAGANPSVSEAPPRRPRGNARPLGSCTTFPASDLGRVRAGSAAGAGRGPGARSGVDGAGRRASPGSTWACGRRRRGSALPGCRGRDNRGMAPPPLSLYLLLLAALVGLLSPNEVVAELAKEAGVRCPEGPWPLPQQVLPKASYTRVAPGQAEDVTFLYHPCAHPWLKLQLALLAHVCVAKPSLIPDYTLNRDRPLVLRQWGMALEMAWVEPAWVAYWLKRRQRRKQRKKIWFHSNSPAQPSPSVPTRSRGRLYPRGCMQAPVLAFAVRSWRPPGTEMPSREPRQHSSSGARRRGLRAALGLQFTSAGPMVPFASPWSLKIQQPILRTQSEGANAPSVPSGPLSPGGPVGNASIRLEGQIPKAQGSPGGCACPSQAPPAPRAAAPPGAARGPTPRTEEAAWAAMALTFLLVLLTLATLCTRLHRNFRRGDSIYWEPTADSQDTVAAVLKRRLLMPARRVKRSRRRPLLPPTPDSGPDVESSD